MRRILGNTKGITDWGKSGVSKNQMMSAEDKTSVRRKYNISKVLGYGAFSEVRLAESKETPGNFYAMKVIDKKSLKGHEQSLENEIRILNTLQHPNIVEIFEVHEDQDKVYLVMELERGGELFDRIIEKGSYTEKDAAEVVKQILSAVGYMHSKGVVHRDLKAENLLFRTNESNSKIMISDFGLSTMQNIDSMQSTCGTLGYVAPEVLSKKPYGKSVDVWSIGVITYILLCGYQPFYDESDYHLARQILDGELIFDSPYWDGISKDAIDFIRKLMCVDVNKRLTCEKALQHVWITGANHSENNRSIHPSVSEKLKSNFARSTWKQAYNVISICRQFQQLPLDNKNNNT